jgi:SAM-dependent methyltransferase
VTTRQDLDSPASGELSLEPALRAMVEAYGAGLARHGATPQGVFWPNAPDLAARLEMMLAPLKLVQRPAGSPLRLLDLGCGPALLLDYLAENGLLDKVDYLGIDLSAASVDLARARWPGYSFEQRDVRAQPFAAEVFDHCLCSGVFTGRFAVPRATFEAMARQTLRAVWPSIRRSLCFNVMSKHVDWERDDLFHWPLDDIMAFCKAELSRHVSMRLDYGLWETTVFVNKAPAPSAARVPASWLETRNDAPAPNHPPDREIDQ